MSELDQQVEDKCGLSRFKIASMCTNFVGSSLVKIKMLTNNFELGF